MLPILTLAPSLISKIKIGLAIAAVAIIALLLWRIDYLAERNAQYKLNESGYKTTIKELRDDAALRDAVALADRNDSVANEMERSEVLNEISSHEDAHDCGSVVNGTIDRLLSQHTSATGN